MKSLIISIKFFLLLTILTGILYPLAVYAVARIFFPEKSAGSILYKNGVAAGSVLIGQSFDTAIYFSSRPSAINNNPLPSGGSNSGMTNSVLQKAVRQRIDHFRLTNGLDSNTVVPPEMVFASGSGLDPDISPDAALLQLDRVARANNFNDKQKEELRRLIYKHIEQPQFKVFGEPRVNVLLLNSDLDKIR